MTGVQFLPGFLEPEKNLKRIREYCQNIESDIVVFPELCLSGYNFNTKEEVELCSQSAESSEFDVFDELSREKDMLICIGFAEKSDEGFYNSSILFLPDGRREVYRKTHLFFNEKDFFLPGNTGFNVYEYEPKNIKIGMMICYDWRFPEAARTLGLKGADVILCPSNLVTDVWHISMPSRALENNLYLLTANRIGAEQNKTSSLVFTGESGIYGCRGELLCKASKNNEESITAIINPRKAHKKAFNAVNDIYRDRRPEMYF